MTNHPTEVVIGIDVGTGGARALAATAQGDVLAEAQVAITDSLADGRVHEQDPRAWWRAVCTAVKSVLKKLDDATSPYAIGGVAVTSTSGSLVLADAEGQPVRHAILYDDSRGAADAEELNRRLPGEAAQFNSSFSLVKAVWVRREEPATWDRVRHLLHPADWLAGKLTGQFGISDDSNALKLGYDSEAGTWGTAITLAGIPAEMLPRVVRPGTPVGTTSKPAGEETGLPPGTRVIAGATDGIASLIASGVCEPGGANTTLGTTLVWKVLSETKPRLTAGMYCHRHPCGLWAPGAASNSGPGSLRSEGASDAPAERDRRAAGHLPTSSLCYLLRSKGERFPFLNPEAATFFESKTTSPAESYAAQLQSLAFVERWGYERLEECGVAVGEQVFSTGSAASSPALSQLRADVLKREVHRCRYPTAAFGAAILAAAESLFGGDLKSAMRRMTRVSESYRQRPEAARAFDEIYARFRAACARRGYV
jgi:sugar (pentulose or hexulose) kinase